MILPAAWWLGQSWTEVVLLVGVVVDVLVVQLLNITIEAAIDRMYYLTQVPAALRQGGAPLPGRVQRNYSRGTAGRLPQFSYWPVGSRAWSEWDCLWLQWACWHSSCPLHRPLHC